MESVAMGSRPDAISSVSVAPDPTLNGDGAAVGAWTARPDRVSGRGRGAIGGGCPQARVSQ